MSYLEIKGLYKRLGHQEILSNVNLSLAKSEMLALVGPSGAGKSTLLRILNTLESFERGHLRVGEAELPAEQSQDLTLKSRLRSKTGTLFQSYNLFPHWTILENITKAPMIVKKMGLQEISQVAHDLLAKVGLKGLEERYPHQVSGGQAQRAAIARALAMTPEVMLYDEPTSALDPGVAQEVLKVMKKIKQDGITQIVVTHDLRFTREVADRVAFMDRGGIVECDRFEHIFHNPKEPKTEQFFKNYFEVTI